VNDLEPSLHPVADPGPTPSPPDRTEPPGPVPAPAPRRGAFPARPSSAARSARIRTVDPLTTLVAEIIGRDVVHAAEVLDEFGGLKGLSNASEGELCRLRVPRARARLVRAAFELARMSFGCRPTIGQRLAGASEVWLHMRARLSGVPVEEFWSIALDVRHRVLADEMCARGSLTGVEIHPRDIFRRLIRIGAAAVVFCHNHPSGDPSPSRADIELTSRLREVGELTGIAVLDHVVVGDMGYVSLAERNWR
jgi:DNA repair protein RadC